MKEIDFVEHCRSCKAWCCYGEYPFTSEAEAKRLGVEAIGQDPDGSCSFLVDGLCNVYDRRPLECRMFPFDLKRIDGKIRWIKWTVCPAHKLVGKKELLALITKTKKQLTRSYVEEYLGYRNAEEPKKYDDMGFEIMKDL
jgi:Fe-S-cluster containining protein